MIALLSFIACISIILFLVGLFNPNTSLFWYKKNRTRKTSTGIYLGAFFVSLIIIGVVAPKATQAEKDKWAKEESEKAKAEEAEASASAPKVPGIGQAIQTEYFAVRVNSFDIKDKVNTGNEFADLKKEPGNKYIVLNVTLKNTDKESRMMFDGELIVKNGGNEIKYDKAETVMLEGWGILMETINPGVTKSTNIVYKVPEDIKGDIYYLPSRSSDDALIKLQPYKIKLHEKSYHLNHCERNDIFKLY